MYVKMKHGSYGHRVKTPDGHIHVVGKTRDDPPFEVDEETGAYLLGLGVATAAEPPEVSGVGSDIPEGKAARRGAESATDDPGFLDEEQLQSMTLKDLKALAQDMELEFPANITKKALVELIASQEVLVPAEAPDDMPPVFDPGEAIS